MWAWPHDDPKAPDFPEQRYEVARHAVLKVSFSTQCDSLLTFPDPVCRSLMLVLRRQTLLVLRFMWYPKYKQSSTMATSKVKIRSKVTPKDHYLGCSHIVDCWRRKMLW